MRRTHRNYDATADMRWVAAVTVACVLGACGSKKKAEPPPLPPAVGYIVLHAQPVPVSTSLTGRVTAALASDVRPQIDGLVLKRLFREGANVRAGQPLYQIDPKPYIAARDQAAAQLANARAALVAAQLQAQRYQSLAATQAASRQQIDNAVAVAGQDAANVAQAAATLRTAEINLAYTTVRAPISGRIGRSAVTPGALVTTNQTQALASIQNLDPIFVDIVQPSEALLALRQSLAKGDTERGSAAVRVTLSNGVQYPHVGRLEFAETVVDPVSGTVTLRAQLPNPHDVLLPGLFVRVEVPQGVVPNGILVPQQGITRTPKGDATAMIVGAGGKAQQANVTVRQAVGNQWLVTAGLKPGERLIVDGLMRAKPGTVVRPMPFAQN